jgi:hypothetical protein
MAASNVLPVGFAAFLSAAVLLVLKPCCEKPPQVASSASAPFYVQRGNRVQEHYSNYTRRLHAYYQSLFAALKSSAPELLSLLEPPDPLQHGYQFLPKIVADAVPVTQQPRAQSAQYSWPWTDHLIHRALSEIVQSSDELHRALGLKPATRRGVYEQLARGYRRIREQQQNIDAHIQYNRLWQGAVSANRQNYDKETLLHDQVLKRQAVLDTFDARQAAALKSGHATSNRVAVAGLNELSTGLRESDNLLAREIDKAKNFFNMPRYVRVKQQSARLWIVHVPFYTDIEDNEFVQLIRREMENTWRLRSGEDEFRVDLEISFISRQDLYRNRKPPHNGKRMNLQEHVDFFPTDGAILTTGALTTHVHGRAIILGPHDITPRVLAHELGHILGFKDIYFRGYKDLAREGLLLMEIVADPNDIMGAPATGAVLRRHYEALMNFREPEAPRSLNAF